ncbi:hypothetical protein FQZ97_651460 [compost metagenome]
MPHVPSSAALLFSYDSRQDKAVQRSSFGGKLNGRVRWISPTPPPRVRIIARPAGRPFPASVALRMASVRGGKA